MVSVLDPVVSKKSLLLLLLDAGNKRSFCGVPMWGRQGCACHWATLRTRRWPMAYDAPCGGNGRYARPA
eukprot:4355114-Prymnesium_polylepis.1